ncbi:MAG TPA: hypothetical protein VK689_13235, partial [Armatimonadota bacterium]|nr:hypothetical protein [Armatimonadota bacterium]
ITQKPVLLAVRSSGSDFLQGTPAPVVQGKYEGDAYLFYRLGSGPVGGPSRAATPGPLVLEYGISPRWFAAAASTALMWLLFPFVALFTTRAHLQRQSRMDAKERLQSYRRWQRGVIFVTIAGALASLFAVGVGKLGYLMGAARAPFFLIAYLAPVSSLSLAGRLIGLPLERDAWPQRRDLPWYKAAGTELVSIGITLLMVAMMLVLTGGGTGMSAPRLRSVLLGIGALFAVSAVCGLIAAACYLGLKRRGHWVAPTDPEAPEELALPIREFSARLDYPVNQVLLSQKRGGFGALNAPVVVKDKVVVPADLADALHPDQVAALVAATALAQPRSRGDKLLSYAGIVLMLLPVLVIGPMIYNVATGRPRPTAMMPLLFLVYPLVMIVSMLTARRQQRRQEEADLRVADALGEPRQFTQALQQLEELQAATTGLDPAATRTPAFTQRRTRLERRLGLD